MADDEPDGFLDRAMRRAGRQIEEAKREYSAARREGRHDLPSDDEGRAKIVCRRFAEERAVDLDDEFRPHCFEADHTDCEGCHEDILEDRIETW